MSGSWDAMPRDEANPPEQVAAEAMHMIAQAVPINGDMYLVIRKMMADAITRDRANRHTPADADRDWTCGACASCGLLHDADASNHEIRRHDA